MYLKNYYLLSCFLFFINILSSSAQNNVISGVLNDDNSVPIPGATIIIKGTTKGVVTNFDGEYSISCNVGDTLVFSCLGMTTREVTVTQNMFGDQKLTPITPKIPVHQIKSTAYTNALKAMTDSLNSNLTPLKSNLIYNKKHNYFNYSRIKNIRTDNEHVKLTYFKPNVYYEIRFNSATSFQFVDKKKLPKLQNRFGQGQPLNGSNAWFGPETNTIFSYGPDVNTLTFDGSNYAYDNNGRLINGVSQYKILPYDNDIFQTSKIQSNNLGITISNLQHTFNANFRRKTQGDLFGIEKSHFNQFHFNYDYANSLNIFFKFNNETNNQPDINGFYSNVLLSAFATPATFKNKQGYIFNEGTQRSFSPDQFNNPYWLLHENKNKAKTNSLVFGAKSNIEFSSELGLKAFLSFKKDRNTSHFGLPFNTIGFNNGFQSKKELFKTDLFSYLTLGYQDNISGFSKIKLESSVTYAHSQLNFELLEQYDFMSFFSNLPSRGSFHTKYLKNDVFRLANKAKFDFNTLSGINLILVLNNNSVLSSLQGNTWFLPAIKAHINFSDLFDYYDWFSSLYIVSNISHEANDIPLYYANRSHNSLNITPQQSQSLTTNNDLFNSNTLDFETGLNTDIRVNLGFIRNKLNIDFNYFTSKTDNGIFPVLVNNIFELQNIASIKNKGFEVRSTYAVQNNQFYYHPALIFSKNKATVLSLKTENTSIPIAGFKTVSKNLIVGEQTGSIVGSAYLRDSNGEIIIDNNGFPFVDPEKQIIGNTTPDFNLSLDNNFKIGALRFSFLIDYQKGGDVWNGTKNVLNYLGRSQESANLRQTNNFIFNGVNQQGLTNTSPVDFANPNSDISVNRWVRYGYNGVDEAAITDGSYINLKSVNCAYDFAKLIKNSSFFRELVLSLYAYNLLSYTKVSGISPYSALFNFSSGSGLDYFNTPLTKEIGFKINIKI